MIYIAVNNEQQGPYSAEQLLAMVNSGQIKADTLVWQEGMADWQPLNTVLAVPKKNDGMLKWLFIIGGAVVFLVIVCVVVGGILLLPALQGPRESARKSHCMSNLKQIGVGLMMFASDHKEKFPDSLNELKKDYLDDDSVYTCPSSNEAYEYTNIGYNTGNADKVLARCRHHGNILYSDGSVRSENKK